MKILLGLLFLCSFAQAAQFEGSIPEWKKRKQTFGRAEDSFNKALKLLKERYVDKNVSEEDLYHAATEGMFAALNSGTENWNTVMSPLEMENLQIEFSGKLSGIGATMSFDQASKNAKVINVIPGSAAQKAALQMNDQILSVNGKRFATLGEMVQEIRGKTGDSVKLKVLREDKIVDFNIRRGPVTIPLVEAQVLDPQTGYLSIDSFTNETLNDVKKKMEIFQDKKLTKLILDLRQSPGGLFDKCVEVADLFLKSGQVIAKGKARDGSVKEFRAKSSPWSPDTRIVILTSPETASSAEILASALKENRNAILVGQKTKGKWSVESLENLPNGYAVKYSILKLESGAGKNYSGVGLTPDFEIAKSDAAYLDRNLPTFKERLETDNALKAAFEL